MTYFDIETGPIPTEEALVFAPEFEAPGNYKDSAAIAKNIAEQQAKWLDRLALSPLTGRVIAIGFADSEGDGIRILHGDDEKAILEEFIDLHSDVRIAPLVGYNIIGFDLPFIWKRALKYKLKCPAWWLKKPSWNQSPLVLDLMEVWKGGDYRAAFAKMDHVAKFLGIPGKTGDHGKFFSELYAENQAEALAYLTRDVELVEEIHGRICQ